VSRGIKEGRKEGCCYGLSRWKEKEGGTTGKCSASQGGEKKEKTVRDIRVPASDRTKKGGRAQEFPRRSNSNGGNAEEKKKREKKLAHARYQTCHHTRSATHRKKKKEGKKEEGAEIQIIAMLVPRCREENKKKGKEEDGFSRRSGAIRLIAQGKKKGRKSKNHDWMGAMRLGKEKRNGDHPDHDDSRWAGGGEMGREEGSKRGRSWRDAGTPGKKVSTFFHARNSHTRVKKRR